jgi:DNA-binding beta-propeller fold protein YncE
MVFDSLGLFQFAVGVPAALTQPAGVAVSDDGQKIFIVDRGSVGGDDHKIIAYSPDNTELFRIGPRGSEPGALNIPLAATTTPDGRLAVLDSGNFRVQLFDLNGKYQSHFGSVGNGYGQFSRPRSIAADSDGNLYISDASFNNVQMFNATGDLLMWIGGPGMENYPGRFGLIAGIAVDETGRLYIADHYHQKVEVYRRADVAQAPGKKTLSSK